MSMRWTAVRLALVGGLGTGLAACARTPAMVAVPAPFAPAALPAPPVRPVPPSPVASSWSFDSAACRARASSPGLSLEMTASGTELKVTVQKVGRPSLRANTDVPIAFTGRSGNWILAGHVTDGRRLVSASPMDEDAVSRALVLLSGGIVRLGGSRSGLSSLRIPDAGQPGRSWFDCVKQRLFP
jgi:hypothetical protein